MTKDLQYLGTDIATNDARTVKVAATGDADKVEGLDCFFQDILNRLSTPRGAIWCHPEYGVRIYDHLQDEDTVANRIEIEQDIRRAIEADPRSEYGTAWAEVIEMDTLRETIHIAAGVQPMGYSAPLNLVLTFGREGAAVAGETGGV